MKHTKTSLGLAVALATCGMANSAVAADSFTEALTGGKAKVDMNFRYETNKQDNPAEDATALTLRTRLGYATGSFNGFSAYIEAEDSRVIGGQDEYKFGPMDAGSPYSVIADPEVTEVDQAFVQYKNDKFTGKLGRQVLTYDGHRFIGHVGWRQDRQTFDALSVTFAPVAGLTINAAHLMQRNRIFGELADVQSKDNLLNISYKTPVGKLTGYSYMLEVDNDTDNALDTFGVSFAGSAEVSDAAKILYAIEFATQERDIAGATSEADYTMLEVGVAAAGFTGKLGYELLGSDDGTYGFSTPLATLHKFNGWADIFLGTPATGLVDTYVTAAYKINGGKGGNLSVTYHSFSADESSDTLDKYGSEIDAVYGKAFTKNYSMGVKLAKYSADDLAVDTDKFWLWFNLKF